MNEVFKWLFTAFGGLIGWFLAEFRPTFPLVIIMVVFCLYDAYTAYKLDKRAHLYYPNATRRHEAKFVSYKFTKVVKDTIPKRLILILLAYLVEHWVCIHVKIPLSYIVTGIICFEQAWSFLENEASCRPETESRFFRFLQRIMIDKTARHFDIDPSVADELTGEKKDKPKDK